MPNCIDYYIFKIFVRAVECVYTSMTTVLIMNPNILNIVAARTKSFGQRVFAYQGPINWNRVPGGIRTVEKEKE